MSAGSGSDWIVEARTGASSGRRLLCLPYAGGGASIYEPLRGGLPGTAVGAVRLPGRESRWREPALDDVHAIVEGLLPSVAAFTAHVGGDRWAVLGYSFGALLAYELVVRLEETGGPVPNLLVVVGASAPHVPRSDPPVSWLPDAQLVEVLREMGGTSEEVLAVPELLELVLPTVRADFRALETYRWVPGRPPVPCPLVTCRGDQDREVRPADVHRWSELTAAETVHRVLPGGHFAALQDPGNLAEALRADLDRHLG